MHTGDRVLLLDPSRKVRSVVAQILAGEGYEVMSCSSVDHLLASGQDGARGALALAAWQSLEGLLRDERRPELQALTRQLRLVLMVPRAWVWDLQRAELGVAGFLAKPFDRDALLECVRRVD